MKRIYQFIKAMEKVFIRGLLFLFFITILFSCKESVSAEAQSDKYEKGKRTLKEIESESPAKFLVVKSSDKRNLLGQTVIRGTIQNKATVTSYKDIDLLLTFFSKTGVKLEEDHEKIYEAVGPGKKTDFKTKYFAPKGTDSVAIAVNQASVAE